MEKNFAPLFKIKVEPFTDEFGMFPELNLTNAKA